MMSANVVEKNPLPSQVMFEEAKKWGFDDSVAQALADLFGYVLGGQLQPEAMKKWKTLGVINAEGNVMLEHGDIDVMEWTLLGLTWEGMIMRVREEADGR